MNYKSLTTLEYDKIIDRLVSFAASDKAKERLKKLVPPGITFVAESGIKTRDDIIKLQNAGADAVLIGETLMRSGDAATALKQLAGVE